MTLGLKRQLFLVALWNELIHSKAEEKVHDGPNPRGAIDLTCTPTFTSTWTSTSTWTATSRGCCYFCDRAVARKLTDDVPCKGNLLAKICAPSKWCALLTTAVFLQGFCMFPNFSGSMQCFCSLLFFKGSASVMLFAKWRDWQDTKQTFCLWKTYVF